ncbi:ParB/RepB/Spo0J family partition protein, partial [Myxococcota bacterium]
MDETPEREIILVPIDQVRVLNPRARDSRRHKEIIANIAQVGLKKPITICRVKRRRKDEPEYDLVCGQGRLEAYEALGEPLIPAILIDVSKEERLLMSLVENMARRNPTSLETAKDVVAMKERGDSNVEIARKTGLSDAYVAGLLNLWREGEHRLLNAVEKGRIPISVAVMIAGAEGKAVQRALTKAYE